MHYLGEESDEDDWPGYTEMIASCETDEDQEDAVHVAPRQPAEESRELDPARAAHKASLDVAFREAVKMETKLMGDEEKAIKKKFKPRELIGEEKIKKGDEKNERPRRNAGRVKGTRLSKTEDSQTRR